MGKIKKAFAVKQKLYKVVTMLSIYFFEPCSSETVNL